MKCLCMKKYAVCVAAVLFAVSSLCVSAADVPVMNRRGVWNGKLMAGPTGITLVFRVFGESSDALQCVMDSPDQGAYGIPAELEYISGDSLAVSIPNMTISFSGRFDGGKIVGVFSQRGFRFPLTLNEGEPALRRPQTPEPPYPYFTEEVTFTNTADGVTLAGTLTLPVGYEEGRAPKPVAVLFVSGSGQQDRNEELFEHKPFLVIADYLARHGIASLRYDDRGVGGSGMGSMPVTLHSNRDDAAAGVEFLKNSGRFGKVGLVGHSEGGTIAFMLAGEVKLDFAVSLAGSALQGDSLLVAQNRLMFLASGIPESVTDSYCAVLEQMFAAEIDGREISGSELDALVEKYGGGNISDALKANLPVVAKQIKNPWFGSFLRYNPSADMAAIVCPVLAVNGEKDLQVPADLSLGAVRRNLPANPKHLIKSYPDLNHLFQHCTTGVVTEYRSIEETISPEVLQDVAEWINSL